MSYPVLFFLAIIGLVLQSTLFNHLIIAGVKPDIILILALFYSIFQGPGRGGVFGFFLGLLEDIFLGRFIGMNALTKGLTSFVFGWIATGAFRENLLVPFLTLFVGTLFNELIFLSLGKIMGLTWSWNLWLWKGIPLAIYNSCLVPFIYARFYNWATQNDETQAG
ncbi:MAG: rod shape-determining protein MreD [Bacillota bacterium]|uniref:Rod shape-determining protein MreD n=1 Tax=Thermanaerosceptrum fracticalcis TaxID=1712410 RepID=A0A7G6E679_THEFR|nr:rod shape-determining protein MreD [Thermanaerosceptrum fracticalcis]QNB47583.1 rod shape-determining protein MreD [Thermanaerosceptrum fracticalcis]